MVQPQHSLVLSELHLERKQQHAEEFLFLIDLWRVQDPDHLLLHHSELFLAKDILEDLVAEVAVLVTRLDKALTGGWRAGQCFWREKLILATLQVLRVLQLVLQCVSALIEGLEEDTSASLGLLLNLLRGD